MFSGADLQFILEATDEPWALADPRGRVLARNPAWSRLLGDGEHLAPAGAHVGLSAALARAADGDTPEAVRLALRDGERSLDVRVALAPAGDGRVRVRAQALAPDFAERAARLGRAVGVAPLILWQIDRDGVFEMSEGGQLEVLGLRPGQVVGMSAFDLYAGSPTVLEQLRRGLAGEGGRTLTQVGELHFATIVHPLRDDAGAVVGLLGISVDVTAQVRAELAAREQQERAERQQRQLQEMALPILQVWDGVLCVPVIGSVDAVRASTIIEVVLRAVVQRRARALILDLTGLDEVDTYTARKLVDVLRGVRLLGARGLVVGIRPVIAQTIVALGLELQFEVLGTLEDALRRCLAERGAA